MIQKRVERWYVTVFLFCILPENLIKETSG
jgi:hypothetical protein